ncbi:hypothetical protein ES708_30011 [subsurface metagenome]
MLEVLFESQQIGQLKIDRGIKGGEGDICSTPRFVILCLPLKNRVFGAYRDNRKLSTGVALINELSRLRPHRKDKIVFQAFCIIQGFAPFAAVVLKIDQGEFCLHLIVVESAQYCVHCGIVG